MLIDVLVKLKSKNTHIYNFMTICEGLLLKFTQEKLLDMQTLYKLWYILN